MDSSTTTKEAPLRTHRLPVKVYLEDTDAQGIVYHASYVRFIERGRTEFFDSIDASVAELAKSGFRLVVHELKITYKRPAMLGDRLEVVTSARLASPYRITFVQEVVREGESRPLCQAEVQVACIDPSGRLCRIPEAVLGVLEQDAAPRQST